MMVPPIKRRFLEMTQQLHQGRFWERSTGIRAIDASQILPDGPAQAPLASLK
jgi:hypothetical protein